MWLGHVSWQIGCKMAVSSHVDPHFGVSRARVLGNMMAIASMVFWAAGFPAAETLLETWHPIALIFMRLVVTVGAVAIVWGVLEKPFAVSSTVWRHGIRIGFLGFGVGTVLLLLGQWYTDPVTVALISTTTPIMATVIEVVKGQRKLTSRFVMGLLASVLGGCVAVGQSLSLDLGLGMVISIAACFMFAWASDASVAKLPDISTLGRTTITFIGATLFAGALFIICAIFGDVRIPQKISSVDLGHLLVYSIAAMAVSQVLFLSAVSRIGIALTSLHINIAPFYVMFLIVLMGGEWSVDVAVGAVLVAIGVAIAQTPKRRRKLV